MRGSQPRELKQAAASPSSSRVCSSRQRGWVSTCSLLAGHSRIAGHSAAVVPTDQMAGWLGSRHYASLGAQEEAKTASNRSQAAPAGHRPLPPLLPGSRSVCLPGCLVAAATRRPPAKPVDRVTFRSLLAYSWRAEGTAWLSMAVVFSCPPSEATLLYSIRVDRPACPVLPNKCSGWYAPRGQPREDDDIALPDERQS
jgi:hypothetical protein